MDMKDRIRTARVAKGMSQAELAEAMEVEPASVSRWEAGVSAPRPAKIPKLAAILERPTSWLVGHDSPPEADPDLLARIEALEQIHNDPSQIVPVVSVKSVVGHIDQLLAEGKIKPVQAQVAKAFLAGDPTLLRGLTEHINRQLITILKAL